MAKNYLQLELGGKKRGLKFNMNTLDKIEQLTGEDPTQFLPATKSYSDAKKYAIILIHAALLSNCDSKKEEPDFTESDVTEWYKELTFSEVTEVINVFKGKEAGSGEADGDTQTVVEGN